eukprot:GEZU01000639.1.p1 GENE.GEZU01000639.1~~GEZU01000639.1.p1  ORF type:complete len:334 (+),score=13.83 GEZU01000639.1:298-1299(+)
MYGSPNIMHFEEEPHLMQKQSADLKRFRTRETRPNILENVSDIPESEKTETLKNRYRHPLGETNNVTVRAEELWIGRLAPRELPQLIKEKEENKREPGNPSGRCHSSHGELFSGSSTKTVWAMGTEAYRNVVVQSPQLEKVEVQIQSDDRLKSPSQRRRELEIEVREQNANKAVREAMRQRARLLNLMKHRYPNGVIGGENLYTSSDVYADRSQNVQRTEERLHKYETKRREAIAKRTYGQLGKELLHYKEDGPDSHPVPTSSEPGSWIFDRKRPTKEYYTKHKPFNLRHMTEFNETPVNVPRLKKIDFGQNRARTIDIISGTVRGPLYKLEA